MEPLELCLDCVCSYGRDSSRPELAVTLAILAATREERVAWVTARTRGGGREGEGGELNR
jgi:hypothetical protein